MDKKMSYDELPWGDTRRGGNKLVRSKFRRKLSREVRLGVTLLELMLALSLTVLLLIAIGMAVSFNLRSLESRRTQVEEAQLARAVMRMISNDLRSAVRYEEVDFSAQQKMAAALAAVQAATQANSPGGGQSGSSSGQSSSQKSQNNNQSSGQTNKTSSSGSTSGSGTGGGTTAAAATSSGGTKSNNASGSSGGNTSGGNSGSTKNSGSSGSSSAGNKSGSSSGSNSSSGSSDTDDAPPNVPGFYGTQTDLQVDISRLPRVDEYGELAAGHGQNDIPSDVKTISYFVKQGTAVDQSTAPLSSTLSVATGSGLARRSVSRLVAKYASDNGNMGSIESQGEIIAPEVTSVEFRYFDGTEWVTEWNSDDRLAHPVAVEINLAIRPLKEPKPKDPQQLTYRLVVALPVGAPSQAGAASAQTTDTSGASTGSATGTATGAGAGAGAGAASGT